MLLLQTGKPAQNCQGMTRRSRLKAGFLGLAGLVAARPAPPRAEGSAARRTRPSSSSGSTAGPASSKPTTPSRTPPPSTAGRTAPSRRTCPASASARLLPHHARHADKMVFVRSLHHDNGDHFAGAHWMLTGRFGSHRRQPAAEVPVGRLVRRRGCAAPTSRACPPTSACPPPQSVYLFPGYQGAAYLGPAYNPFDVDREQKYLPANYTTTHRLAEAG